MGIYGLDTTPEDAGVILIPVPWEATTSYGRGTAQGPAAIVEASVQVDLFDVALRREPAAVGIAMLDADPAVVAWAEEAARRALAVIARFDAGEAIPEADLQRVNELSAMLDRWVEETAAHWRARGKTVGVVGGDHSVAFGAIAAAAAAHPGMGVLQIDAHADLRVAYQGFTCSHASVMHNVLERLPNVAKLVSVGVRDLCAEEHAAVGGRVEAFFDVDLDATSWERVADALPEEIYISFDIDGLDPSLCPNTGTPVPGGLSFRDMERMLAALRSKKKKIVGFDLCEVAPGEDEWDANVGARVLYKLIGSATRAPI